MTVKFQFCPMEENLARSISGWTYEAPYTLYSWEGSEENIAELMSGAFWAAADEQGELAGFICTGEAARVPGGYAEGIYEETDYLDLGLGLKPEFTGKGIGIPFLNSCLFFAHKQFGSSKFRLVVAEFNERAMKVYERAGFVKGERFISKVDTEELAFFVMRLSSQD